MCPVSCVLGWETLKGEGRGVEKWELRDGNREGFDVETRRRADLNGDLKEKR
jgi:hypothetical protein